MMDRVKGKRNKQIYNFLKPCSLWSNHPIHKTNGRISPPLKWMFIRLPHHSLRLKQVLLSLISFPSSLKPKASITSLEEVYMGEERGLSITSKTLGLPHS